MTESALALPAGAELRYRLQQPEEACTLTLKALILYFFVAAGRIHGLFPWLAPGNFPIGSLTGGLVILVFLKDVSAGGMPKNRCIEMKLVLGLVALGVLGIPTSVWPGGSVTALVGFSKTAILFFVPALLARTLADIKKLSFALVISALLFGAVSSLKGISHGSAGITGNTYDANDIALIMLMMLPFHLYFISSGTKMQKWLSLVSCPLSVLTIILTTSRGGFLGLLCVAAYILVKMRRRLNKTIVMAVVVSVAIFMFAAKDAYWERISTIWAPQSDYDKTAGDRTGIWERGLGLIARDPVMGAGIGNFTVAEGMSKESGRWITAHNSFIQVAGELGIPGLVVFFILSAGSVRRLEKLRGSLPDDEKEIKMLVFCIQASMVAFLVSGFFLSQAYLAYLYYILGISAALQELCRERFGEPEEAAGAGARERRWR